MKKVCKKSLKSFWKIWKKKYKKNKIKNLIFDEKIKKIMSHLRHRTIFFFFKVMSHLRHRRFYKKPPGGPFL